MELNDIYVVVSDMRNGILTHPFDMAIGHVDKLNKDSVRVAYDACDGTVRKMTFDYDEKTSSGPMFQGAVRKNYKSADITYAGFSSIGRAKDHIKAKWLDEMSLAEDKAIANQWVSSLEDAEDLIRMPIDVDGLMQS